MPDNKEFFDISDISKLNLDKIVSQLPGAPWWRAIFGQTQGKYVKAFLASQDMLKAHGLNTALRLGHFLGQGLIETGFLRYTAENLNYSASALRKVFGKYFKTDAEAAEYARKPEKIANKVYGNRMGNGDEASGDGWKYRGRGFIQLTGKNNYERFAELTGLPIDTDPDLLSRDLKASIQVAAKFFEVNNLLQYADANDAKKVSRGINFGNPDVSKPAHGEAERIWWTQKALSLFKTEAIELIDPRNGGTLQVGDTGSLVEEYQRQLAGLGFAIGGVDGDYGPATKRAVIAFQEQAGLPISGDIDQLTALAIDAAVDTTPAGANRNNATVDDLRAQGDATPDDTNQIGVGGAVIGVAVIAAGASEVLGSDEDVSDAPATPPPAPEATQTPDAPATPPQTETSTEAPAPTLPVTVNTDPNWVLIASLVIIGVAAIWMFTRAGKIKKDRVEDYRDGKIV